MRIAASLLCLILSLALPAAAQGWELGWPGTAPGAFYDPANVSLGPHGFVQLRMTINGGNAVTSGAATSRAILRQPSPREAWCITARMKWSRVRGIWPALWMRPADWNENWPEFDPVEATAVPDAYSTFMHYDGNGVLLGQGPGSGRMATYRIRMAHDRFWVSRNRKLTASGALTWPASGFISVVTLAAFDSFGPDWGSHRLAPGSSGRATFEIRRYRAARC